MERGLKYLGLTVERKGGTEKEVKKRIHADLRKISRVVCHRRIPVRLKGNVYKTAVRPAMMYGLETIGLTKR